MLKIIFWIEHFKELMIITGVSIGIIVIIILAILIWCYFSDGDDEHE